MVQRRNWTHGPALYSIAFAALSLVALYNLTETNVSEREHSAADFVDVEALNDAAT